MTQWIRCFPCKNRDVSSNPQTHVKPGAVVLVSSPRAPKARWEVETREFSEAPRSAGLAYVAVSNKKRNPVSNKVEGPVPEGGPTSKHVLWHTYTRTHQHTCMHT